MTFIIRCLSAESTHSGDSAASQERLIERENLDRRAGSDPYLEDKVRKWQCLVCGFIYEEALGLPDDGIPAGTSWDDIPDDWMCPECGVGKEDFEMIESQ